MRKDTQAGAHIQFPDNARRGVGEHEFFPPRRVAFTIAETAGVKATQLALSSDVEQPAPFDIRCARSRRQQEISQASLHSRSHVLPKERAIIRSKGHEHTAV